jgi:hypothetical protein
MSYATLMVYLNVDCVSKQLIGVAAKLAEKFSAKLIGVSALAIMPPVAAEGVVIVDNASEFDIALMKAKLADAENKFRTAAGAGLQIEWRAALELPTDTLIREARCADLILLEKKQVFGRYVQGRQRRSGNSGSRASDPGGACRRKIPSSGACCHRMEGHTRGEAGGGGCIAVPP